MMGGHVVRSFLGSLHEPYRVRGFPDEHVNYCVGLALLYEGASPLRA
jgi:hypothetical protein